MSQLLFPKWAPGQGPAVAGADTLFLLDPRSEGHVLSEGGRLSDEYSLYFSPDTGRAPLVPGPFGRLGVGQSDGAGRPALVYPLDGLLPDDEFTLSFWFRTLRPSISETILVQAARVLNITYDGARLEVAHRGTTTTIDAATTPGQWTPVTVVWTGRQLTVWLGDDQRTAAVTQPVDPTPASWCDGGLLLLPGAVDQPEVELAELSINRWARTAGKPLLTHGPTISIDAAAPTGAEWSPALGGALALYTGFRMWRDVDTHIRDQQFERCAAAGLPLVRVSGLVTGFDYLDDKLRVWGERGVPVHVTLDYNHPRTGAGHEDWDTIRVPPNDFHSYAELCSEVLAEVRSRVDVHSVALWNEPDIEEYWSGTIEQFFELWAAVQRQLAKDHPDLPLASGDFAHAETAQQFLRWAGERGLPVPAVHTHNYDQDFAAIAARIKALRQTADEAGYPGIPIRITEWGMHIMRQRELYTGTTSVNRAWPNRFRTKAAAAYCLAFLAEVTGTDPLIDMGAFSSVGSVEPELLGDENLFVSDEAMLSTDDPPTPFPSFYAMTLLWKLHGRRVSAASNWPGVRAIATKDGDVVTVVYGAYRPWRGYDDKLAVAFDWAGLPERFTWCRWTVTDHGLVETAGDESGLPAGADLDAYGVECIRITGR